MQIHIFRLTLYMVLCSTFVLLITGCSQQNGLQETQPNNAQSSTEMIIDDLEPAIPEPISPITELPVPREVVVDDDDEEEDTTDKEPQVSMTMTRSVEPYMPGGAVEVTVTLDFVGEDPVTALAIEETLPSGWKFGVVSGGDLPAISPDTGHTGTFALVWINIPEWPATVHYLIEAPDHAEGTYTLTGQAVYRKLAGELRTPMLDTPLQPEE